jgi:hypothetical protein
MALWFPRADKKVTVEWTQEEELKALKWLESIVNRIKNENDFVYNNENEYFCNNLCGVRAFCEYR